MNQIHSMTQGNDLPKNQKPHALSGFRDSLEVVFGIYSDPRAYTSLLYFALSFVTGLAYGMWSIISLIFTAVSCVFVIGIPVGILFVWCIRALAWLECILVRYLLGVTILRRPILYRVPGNILTVFSGLMTDMSTWRAYGYLLLTLPLGLVFSVLVMITIGTIIDIMLISLHPIQSDIAVLFLRYWGIQSGIWLLPVSIGCAAFLLTLLLHGCRIMCTYYPRYIQFMLLETHGKNDTIPSGLMPTTQRSNQYPKDQDDADHNYRETGQDDRGACPTAGK
jgi:hypothetical protein